MNTVKLQVPMDKDVRDALEKRAEQLGFDSAQAYIRFWAKAEADGRQVEFGDDWGSPSANSIKMWESDIKELETSRKNGSLKSFETVSDLMEDLMSNEEG